MHFIEGYKQELKNWKSIPYSWTEILLTKMPTLLKSVYKYLLISIRFPKKFW